MNENFNNYFDERIFVFNNAKNIITFFRKVINYNANNFIIAKIEKIDNKIFKYILLFFDEQEKKYKKLLLQLFEIFCKNCLVYKF